MGPATSSGKKRKESVNLHSNSFHFRALVRLFPSSPLLFRYFVSSLPFCRPGRRASQSTPPAPELLTRSSNSALTTPVRCYIRRVQRDRRCDPAPSEAARGRSFHASWRGHHAHYRGRGLRPTDLKIMDLGDEGFVVSNLFLFKRLRPAGQMVMDGADNER